MDRRRAPTVGATARRCPKAGDHEDLRALLNAGHRRGATVPRCVGEGTSMTVQLFPVFPAWPWQGAATCPTRSRIGPSYCGCDDGPSRRGDRRETSSRRSLGGSRRARRFAQPERQWSVRDHRRRVCRQQFLYFRPLPHGHESLRPVTRYRARSSRSATSSSAVISKIGRPWRLRAAMRARYGRRWL